MRTRLYHSDVLIMDGLFSQGSRLLLETYEAIGATAPLIGPSSFVIVDTLSASPSTMRQAEYLYRQAMSAAIEGAGPPSKTLHQPG